MEKLMRGGVLQQGLLQFLRNRHFFIQYNPLESFVVDLYGFPDVCCQHCPIDGFAFHQLYAAAEFIVPGYIRCSRLSMIPCV